MMMPPQPMRGLPRVDDVGLIHDAFDQLVDDHVGIVHSLQEVHTEPGSPNYFHYAAEACNTRAFVAQRNFFNTGGASVHRSVAMAKAVGEAVERYCAAIYDAAEMPLLSRREANFDCVAPAEFALHSAEQYMSPGFPWVVFDDDTPVRWTPALNLARKKTQHVPAAFTWIPYFFDSGLGEPPIGQPISTGLACHADLERASLAGLCEVVERDAFTLFWQRGLAPPRLRVETLSEANYDRVARFEATGDNVFLLDLGLDHGVPCVLSVLRSGAAKRPAMVFAASADPDPERAVAKALEELAHTRRYSQRVHRHLPPVDPANEFEQVCNQMDHLNFAGDHSNCGVLEFVLSSRERRSFDDIASMAQGDPAEQLDRLVERIRCTGHEVLRADLTSEDIRELGLRVVRILIPGYHPLFMGHRWRALGGKRLWQVPEALGLQAAYSGGRDNPFPHPYP